jgi:hypothetical protein
VRLASRFLTFRLQKELAITEGNSRTEQRMHPPSPTFHAEALQSLEYPMQPPKH